MCNHVQLGQMRGHGRFQGRLEMLQLDAVKGRDPGIRTDPFREDRVFVRRAGVVGAGRGAGRQREEQEGPGEPARRSQHGVILYWELESRLVGESGEKPDHCPTNEG